MASESPKEPAFKPVDVESLPWRAYSGGGARFGGRARVLSDTSDRRLHIGVVIEELAPGKQSVPFHYHLLDYWDGEASDQPVQTRTRSSGDEP
jgi:hypothetical protein